MHWAEVRAREVIANAPNKEEYVCAAGISPSGSVHIGNFRDIVTSYFVCLAIRNQGKKARLLFSWDEFDRFRKVPANVSKTGNSYEEYIGKPYVDVPDPFGCHETYALHFEREFEESLTKFGIDVDFRYQADMYRAGKYTKDILLALKERKRIFDILDSFRTQEAEDGERENYYPVSIYCPSCGRDTTKIKDYDDETHVAHYECKCGHQSEFDFNTNFNCKLSWKVDWAMRWRYESVDFEPGGHDHASPSGSFQTSRIIANEIFGFEAPIFQGYGFIGLKGATGKMSGSSGLNLTPKTLLKIYEPEVILWLYSKADPLHEFDFFFDDGILRQYTEFDRMYNGVLDGTAKEAEKGIMLNCTVKNRQINTVSMTWLVQFGSVVNFNPSVLETVFTKIGTPYKSNEFFGRLELAQNWLEMCSPESVNHINEHRNWAVYDGLTEDEKKEVVALHRNLSSNKYSLDELNTMLYAVPSQVFGTIDDAKRKKALQATFFKNVYMLLIGKEKGPRLYLFLYALEHEQYMHLLDFSTPKTENEAAAVLTVNENPAKETTADNSEEDNTVTVLPIKSSVQLDDFAKLDLRVCEIIKCQEIRKSHNCYKLTLNDGLGERVIVSSIKHDYTPEQLVGRKIIVFVNLVSARITGVTSEGMLFVTTNDNGNNKVIFADDQIPNGSSLH